MFQDLLQTPPRREATGTEKFQCTATAMSADLLSRCGDTDWQEMKRCFWLLVAVAVYQSIVFATLGTMLWGEGGVVQPHYVAVAIVPAIIIALLESALILAPSYLATGIAVLEKSGLSVPGIWGRRVKNGIAITLRLVFALACAQMASIAITLNLLHKDSSAQLALQWRRENAVVIEAAAKRHDEAIGRAVAERDQAREVADRLRAEEQKLRQAAVDPVTDDPQLAAQIARIEQMRTAMLAADQELAKAQKDANDELTGRRGTKIPGYGPARIALDETVIQAEKRYRAAKEALVRAEQQLETLRDKVAGAAQGKGQEASKRLDEVMRAREVQEQRLTALEERADALVRDREKLIRAAVEADAAQASAQDGILARAKAIHALVTSDWSALAIVLLFDVLLFFVEVAVLLSKTFAAPTMYSTLVAYQHVVGGHLVVKEIAEIVNAVDTPVAEALLPHEEAASEPVDADDARKPESSDPGEAEAPVPPVQPNGGGPAEPLKRGRGRPKGSLNRKPPNGPSTLPEVNP